MTTLIQLPNTPEIFAKVERRLAEAIHEEAKYLAAIDLCKNLPPDKRREIWPINEGWQAEVRRLRGIRQALKDGAAIQVDAAFYWSLMNETATTQKPEIP